MERFYELLDVNNLTDDDKIDSEIITHWSLKRILDFANSLNYEIVNSTTRTKEYSLTDYAFAANSELSAQHNTCREVHCRLRRIDDLARYATLYADHLYVRNYFSDYENVSLKEPDNYDLRYAFAGDLKIMYRLKPLFEAQIVSFVRPFKPGIHLCLNCAEKIIPGYKNFNKSLRKSVQQLNKEYSAKTLGTISLSTYRGKPLYSFTFQGAEDLWCNEGYIIQVEKLPASLSSKILSMPESTLIKGIPLTSEDLLESHLIEHELMKAVEDIWMQRVACAVDTSNVKYLTNRDVDLGFLGYFEKNPKFRTYTDVLQTQLTYKLPILTGVPLQFLVDIRKNEYDSFIVFRDSINLIVSEYISQHKELSVSDAKQIYLDLVLPKLNKLNLKVKSIATSRQKKAIVGTLIAGGVLTFGVMSSFLTPEMRTAVLSAAALQGVIGLDSIVQSKQIPEEIRNDNLFFLWKASTHGK